MSYRVYFNLYLAVASEHGNVEGDSDLGPLRPRQNNPVHVYK